MGEAGRTLGVQKVAGRRGQKGWCCRIDDLHDLRGWSRSGFGWVCFVMGTGCMTKTGELSSDEVGCLWLTPGGIV